MILFFGVGSAHNVHNVRLKIYDYSKTSDFSRKNVSVRTDND